MDMTDPLRERKNFTISRSEYTEAKNILSLRTYPNIRLHHCLKPIPISVFQNLKYVLTSLTLSSLTSFSIIVSCIQNLSALKGLFFKMILIDKKYSLPFKPKFFKVPNLKQLSFEHQLEQPNNDIFLLDFFSINVTFGNLQSFSFVEKDENMQAGEVKVPTEPEFKALFNITNSQLPDDSKESNSSSSGETRTTESYALTKFIKNNIRKLKVLRLTDHAIKVGNFLSDIDNLPHLTLAFLRLQKFTYSMDDSGQQYILSCQRKLEHLNGTGFIFDYNPEDVERFFAGVCKNYRTLTSIRIYPNIIFSEMRHSKTMEEMLSSVSIDCEVFLQCPVLLALRIDLNVVDGKSGHDLTLCKRNELNIRKIGMIYNLHTLPEQLQNLIVYGNFLHQEEVQLLIKRLGSFGQLDNFTLGISYSDLTNDCFTPTLEWVQILLQCSFQNLRVAKFVGCNETENVPEYPDIKNFVDANGILMEKQMLGKSASLTFTF
ncbi:unnamed protein product [Allacma fusca]|uniref:Uncharacterized protein n=1 Tax=Allacma fusca TaxID=39272 RepID=A0A8J2M5X8_9HEXA|nr:unnamed protein product [Allacma fusca]